MQDKKIHFSLLGLLILVYFIVFIKLDSFHMRWWDESMFAVNTYEMIHNGNYFSLFFDGAPDNYNTKPPLTSWIQVIFVKLLGYNELALRLPSAIAAAFCIFIIFIFLWKNYCRLWAWLSALILLTSWGFINFHTARTAESDSLLTLFLLVANLYFLRYILHEHSRNIFLFLLFITLAFAAKMFVALLFTPAYIIILLQQKKLKEFVFSKAFFSGITVFLLISIGLAYFRELSTPGYIKEIFFKDAGRIFNVVENHREPFIFYIDNLFTIRFATWMILLLIGGFFWYISDSGSERLTIKLFFILTFTYLMIVSISITKLEWYDMPLYPYLAMISGYALYKLIDMISVGRSKPEIGFIVLIFAFPYYKMFDKSQGNTINNGEKILEANERYIFKREKENKNLDGLKVFYNSYKGSLLFYKYKLIEKGQDIELKTNNEFKSNDMVLVSNDSMKTVLKNTYAFDVIDQYDKAILVQIRSRL